MIEIRTATPGDEDVLRRIDEETRSVEVSPADPDPDRPFFHDGAAPHNVLVAELDGAVAGWAMLVQDIPLPSHRHVLEIRGFAVDPAVHRRGVGRALLDGTVAEAVRRGAQKVTLRVLGSNPGARVFYESCGFEVEGVLRGEFYLAGKYVDDVVMARWSR